MWPSAVHHCDPHYRTVAASGRNENRPLLRHEQRRFVMSASSFSIFSVIALLVSSPSKAEWRLVDFYRESVHPGNWSAGTAHLESTITNTSDSIAHAARVEVTFALAPQSQYAFTVVNVDQFAGDDFEVYPQYCSDGIFSVTGSFFQRHEKVISGDVKYHWSAHGRVVINGEEVSPLVNWTFGGAIVDDGSQMSIVPVKDLDGIGTPWMLLQSKPIVLQDGKNGIFSNDGALSNWRTVVGTTKGNEIFAAALIGSAENISLYDVGEILEVLSDNIPSALEDVIATDGGPGTHIFIPHFNISTGGFPNYVPNIVCIVERN